MWRMIDGVVHISLDELAVKFPYNIETLRRLAAQKRFYARKEDHHWWTTEHSLIEYQSQDSRRVPGRRKPRAEGGRRRGERVKG